MEKSKGVLLEEWLSYPIQFTRTQVHSSQHIFYTFLKFDKCGSHKCFLNIKLLLAYH